MLTLQVASDLHLELHQDGGHSFIESLDPTGVDVLVLAGDILSARFAENVERTFTKLAAKYPRVLYVPGNHEFWKTTPEETMHLLGDILGKIPNVTMLNNQIVTIEGRRFIGGPMWLPQWGPLSAYAATEMPDFQLIAGFSDWAVKENAKFKDLLEKNLHPSDVVLTHYLPSYKSVSPRHKGSSVNPFFVSEMDQLILDRKPALWIHGHTHDPMNYLLGNTRIVCNPFGYPKELNTGYEEKLLISIG